VNLPYSTPAQITALTELEQGLATLAQASTAARTAIVPASFSEPSVLKVSVPGFDNLTERGTEPDRGPVRSLTVRGQDGNFRGMTA